MSFGKLSLLFVLGSRVTGGYPAARRGSYPSLTTSPPLWIPHTRWLTEFFRRQRENQPQLCSVLGHDQGVPLQSMFWCYSYVWFPLCICTFQTLLYRTLCVSAYPPTSTQPCIYIQHVRVLFYTFYQNYLQLRHRFFNKKNILML